jgi:hypothetical protein
LRVECFPILIGLTIPVRALVPLIVRAQRERQSAPFSAQIHEKVVSAPPNHSLKTNHDEAAIRC